MSSHIQVSCPSCRRGLDVRRAYVGRTVGCRSCGQIFLVVAAEDPTSLASPDSSGQPPPGSGTGPARREIPPEIDPTRERPRGWVHGPDPERRPDALPIRRWTEDLDAIRVGRERLDAERRAALGEANRLRAALDQANQSLLDSRRGHEAAYGALAQEHEEARHRWERERREEAERREQERSDHAQRMSAALRHAEEQVAAVLADLDRRSQAQDDARRLHERDLAALREDWAAEGRLGMERLASAREQFESERGSLRKEIESLREGLEATRQERDLSLARLGAAERERERYAALGASLEGRVRDLESERIVTLEQVETAREEAEQRRDELPRLRQMLEQAQGREQAAAERCDRLMEQVRDLQIELEGERRGADAERLEFRRTLATLREEMEAGRGDLDATRQRFHQELLEVREECDRRREEADLLRQERDLALSDVVISVQRQECLARAIDEVEASREGAEEQFRAGCAQLAAELEEAGRQLAALADRNEELSGEVAGLRAELDRRQNEHRSPTQPDRNRPNGVHRQADDAATVADAGRSRVAGIFGAMPRALEDRTDHRPPENRETAPECTGPQGAGPRGESDRFSVLNGAMSSRPSCRPEESPSMAFPSEADLAIVRRQVEMLTELLSPERSPGRVLIYQQRLAEFSRKVREASRLATVLVKEVEHSRRRDQMQFHMYILRRSEEIEKHRS